MLSVIERYPLPELPEVESKLASEQFGFEIIERLDEMEYEIDCAVASRDFAPRILSRIPNIDERGKVIDTYVEHMAMHELLRRKGLLEQFYDDELAYSAGGSRWQVSMERPLDGSRYTELYTLISVDLADSGSGATHAFTLRYHLLQR